MIGVGIIAFNRPGYLRRLLASLEAQTDLHDCDFHCYLDGAINPVSNVKYAEQKDIDACARLFAQSKLPNKWLHQRETNANIGIASFDVTEELTATYERVMQLEDDIVLSPHWFRLARILYDELEAHPNVYAFSPGFRRVGPKSQDPVNLNRIAYVWSHMWVECFTADRWQRIRDKYMEYHVLIAGPDYREVSNGTVTAYYESIGMTQYNLAVSQDGGREMAIRHNGMLRAQCAVNRALSIGQYGLHFTPERFKRLGFENQAPFIFADDATREGFTWDA